MLSLAEQVHCNPVRICLAIADNENFRRAGNHVDPYRTEHISLSGSNISVAGTDDLSTAGIVFVP